MNDASLQAGVAQVDITPPLGTLINGDFTTQYARHVHDPLYAKAMVLQAGGVSLLFLVIDICLMDKAFADDVRTRVATETAIPFQNILLCATHTHAAGSVTDVLLGAADLSYRLALPYLIVKAAVKACAGKVAAQIGFGSVKVPEHVLCRRYVMKDGFDEANPVNGTVDKVKTNPFRYEHLIERPAAKPNDEVCFLYVKDSHGKPLSLLANYSLHYVGDWPPGTISADYFGVFAKAITTVLTANENFVAMMTNGASGDVNIWDFLHPERYPKEDFAKSKFIGEDIAKKVTAVMNEVNWQEEPSLSAFYTELPLAIRKPSAKELEEAKAIASQTDYAAFSPTDANALKKLYAREQVLLNEYPDEVAVPVQVFRIGKVAVGAVGAEFFSKTGLRLKQEVSSPYFTITLSNGFFGYVPPEREFQNGGYETWRSRNSRLEEGAERKVCEAVMKLVQSKSVTA